MEIWNDLILLSDKIETLFNDNLQRYPIPEDVNFSGWKDQYWRSDIVRKCHLKTIDNRSTQKLWLMHINIFPRTDVNIPILGFDIVAGPNKITGSFFDFSPIGEDHEYSEHFKLVTNKLNWNKPRELPEWASKIFSKNMIAVGNIKTKEEIEQLSSVCFNLIEYYIKNLNTINSVTNNYKHQHNFYCKQQKLNPHLHRSILAMGISEEDKDRYVNRVLFEEIS